MAACGMPFNLGGGFALRSSSKRPREGQPPARFKGVGVERLRPVAQLAERGPHSPRQRRGSVLERMAPRQPRVVAHEGRVAHGRVRVAHPLPRRVRQPQARHTPAEIYPRYTRDTPETHPRTAESKHGTHRARGRPWFPSIEEKSSRSVSPVHRWRCEETLFTNPPRAVLAQRLTRHRQGGKVAAGRGALGDCPRERRRPHLREGKGREGSPHTRGARARQPSRLHVQIERSATVLTVQGPVRVGGR